MTKRHDNNNTLDNEAAVYLHGREIARVVCALDSDALRHAVSQRLRAANTQHNNATRRRSTT